MLLDTSGLLCLQHAAEPFHSRACDAYHATNARLTHSDVLAEYVALAQARKYPRGRTLAFLADLQDNPDIETVWVDEGIHREALALLLARPDKAYSLCDAVSFILMRDHGIDDALSTDRHFEQEGFRRLLG